jgi:peptide-methionine (S)-S-oxide reductase
MRRRAVATGRFRVDTGSELHRVARGPAAGEEEDTIMKKATFGAGCFWGIEETFRRVEGVTDAAVGYAGGTLENPTYEQVCSDETGHAEVVEVTYDPARVSFEQLLDVFWNCHNPTTRNRQGPDVGTQYRSVIFYHDDEQKQAAQASRERLQASGRFPRPIVTQIEPAPPFYRAEEYHQRYLAKNGLRGCSLGH